MDMHFSYFLVEDSARMKRNAILSLYKKKKLRFGGSKNTILAAQKKKQKKGWALSRLMPHASCPRREDINGRE
jgi:hypothetical protein